MLSFHKVALLFFASYALAGDGLPRYDAMKRQPGHGLILDSRAEKQERAVNVELLQDNLLGNEVQLLAEDVVHSAHTHKVEVSGLVPGRGRKYAAAVPIAKGEEIVSISIDDVMSIETAKTGRINMLVEANDHLPPAVVLALHLLEEKFKGVDSHWHDFIAYLPSKLHSTLFASDENTELMEGSHVGRLTETRRQAIADFFAALESPLTSNVVDPPFFTPAQFTLKNFQWAMVAVWAHSILIPKEGNNTSNEPFDAVLVPIVSTLSPCDDCENHITVEDGYLSLVATAPLAVGDEIQLSLGANSMALYMLNHGFVPKAPSPHDVVQIGLQVESSDPLLVFKNEILHMMNMTMDMVYAPAYGASTLAPSMLQSIRAKVLTTNELKAYKRVLEKQVVSIRNEHAVCRALVQSIKALLGQYARSPAQVDAGLADPNIASVTRDILRAVQVEQTILKTTHDLVLAHWSRLLTDDSLLPRD
ncbi:unnamed protein product [Aphanomyces euteiches]|uniref:Rubisco LSMT substrate-binding domain-containing protein n=1 Tax=Aphanomyces euteiches TaxID=100861 RepID=A0A6G0XTA0_9STRA|nr:hypothetical protein Ae201684_001508 [Aphanomyces euteiches]KAH9075458.1 hypothetical protein Ae201684P_004138 [Aphanomyces euteiches]KAH9139312.1 hypothetical protein AeRB84_016411 [Aphanomyces euteiches]